MMEGERYQEVVADLYDEAQGVLPGFEIAADELGYPVVVLAADEADGEGEVCDVCGADILAFVALCDECGELAHQPMPPKAGR